MEPKQKMPLHTMLFRLSQAQRKQLFDANNPTCLTSGQPKILRYLRHNGWKSQSEIAQNCSIEPPTASRLIESLLREKLIQRKDNEHDKRSYLIAITQKGIEQMERWDDYAQKFEHVLFDGMSPADLDQLRVWFNQMYINMTGRPLDE